MARPARNTRRGDEEFVNAALIALAVTKNFDLGEPETAKASPSAALGVLMLAIFERLQTGHPDVERIQRAHLEFEHTSEGFQFNSDIFPDHYLMIPHYTALTDEELASFQSIAYRALQGRAYFCAEQMMLAADPSAQLSEFPTRDDFVDLCEWLAREGFGTVASLDWVMQGDVLFGVETHLLLDLIKEKGPDAEIDARLFRPVLRHGQALATYTASLEGSISADNPCSARARALRDLAVGELKLLQRTLAQSFQVFEAVDTIKEPESVAARLSDAVGDGVLPATRALAAEHMGYLYNRAATVARTQDLAESFYSAAVACSHYAYETSGSPRHAKYVAQNMLEIASLRSDDVLKACAETVWVDAYVVPFHLGLHRPGSREFEDLGWTAPVYRLSDSRFDYTDIPPYSVDPTFVYEGSAAEGLREINPSFPPDLWAAAVLVVQRFKDLRESRRIHRLRRGLAALRAGCGRIVSIPHASPASRRVVLLPRGPPAQGACAQPSPRGPGVSTPARMGAAPVAGG